MIAGNISKRDNKNAQIYASSYGWTRTYAVQKKSDCHETLSVLFNRDGVPPALIMDGSKEQTLGNFARKLRKADCTKRQIEPHLAWSNACDLNIRELKR